MCLLLLLVILSWVGRIDPGKEPASAREMPRGEFDWKPVGVFPRWESVCAPYRAIFVAVYTFGVVVGILGLQLLLYAGTYYLLIGAIVLLSGIAMRRFVPAWIGGIAVTLFGLFFYSFVRWGIELMVIGVTVLLLLGILTWADGQRR